MIFPDTEKWKPILPVDRNKLADASLQLHYATQFIVILGNYLLENKPGDSHTNAEWLYDQELLAGNWIEEGRVFRLALDINKFKLLFLDGEINEMDSFELDGMTCDQVFAWLENAVVGLGVNIENSNQEMFYNIPESEIAKGKPFTKPEQKILSELSKLRSNANFILEFITSKFKNPQPIRIWPHHFDTGTVLAVKKDEEGRLTKSIGLGMAVPDSIVNDYYFYASPWSSENKINYDSLPDLSNSGKWHIQNWNGAYLPVSEVLKYKSREDQVKIVNGFMISAIDACLFLLDSTGLFSGDKFPA